MKLGRGIWTVQGQALFKPSNIASVAKTLTVWAMAALLLIPAGMALAQETPPPASNGTIDAAEPDAETDDPDAQAPEAAETLPPVTVITDAPGEESADAATVEPTSEYVAQQPVPPTSYDAAEPTESTVERAIFNAPVEGDTLNRGTTGIDGYFASGTSAATKTNTLIEHTGLGDHSH